MTDHPAIRVVTYDGYRAGERPIAVIIDDVRLDVKEIEDTWISTGVDPQSEVCYGFVVRCYGGMRFQLSYSEERAWRGKRLPGPAVVK
jgi:hypothetical protein